MAVKKYIVIRLFEFCLCCILIGLQYHSLAYYRNEIFLLPSTYISFLIITVGLIVGEVMEKPIHRYVALYFLVVGAGLMIGAGAFIIDHWHIAGYRTMKAKGVLSIIAGIVYLVDAIFTYRVESNA